MPVAIEMALLVLLFGGSWAQAMNMGSLGNTSAAPGALASVSDITVTSGPVMAMDPLKVGSPGDLISTPASSTSFIASETLGTDPPVPESTAFLEVSTKKPSMFPEVSNTTSDPAVPSTTNSLGPHTGPGGTVATSSLKSFNGTSGPPVTIATSSLETSHMTSGPPVTMATTSLETSSGRSGPPVTMATSSLETSSGRSGPSVTMATSSLETPSGRSGPPVTMAPSPPEPRTSGAPVSGVKILAMATSTASVSLSSDQGMNGSLLVAVLVALLVVGVLVALLGLWRQRQKRRTGALTLNRAAKRNGAVDAWAGPARVPDEEAVTAAVGEPRGDKGSGVPDVEATGRRPTLITFFGRRKSRPGSLALEELEAGSAPSPKGEEEPLVGREDGASDGPETGDESVPQNL